MQEEKGSPADAVPMVVEESGAFLLFCRCVSVLGGVYCHGVRVRAITCPITAMFSSFQLSSAAFALVDV